MLKLDSHIHSQYSSDCLTKIDDIIDKSIASGLDIIAISDHNNIRGSEIAIEKTASNEDLLVVPSLEVSSLEGHIVGFGCTDLIPSNLSAHETIDRIHDNGGLAIIPHPYCFYRHGLFCKANPSTLNFDAIETKNARFIIGYCNSKALKLSKLNKIPSLGASDSHFIDFLGDCYSNIDCEMDIDSVLKAIKKGKVSPAGQGTSNIKMAKYLFDKNILKKY